MRNLVLGLACSAIASGALAQESASFRTDASHSGRPAVHAVPNLSRTRWVFETKGQVYGSPVIAGDPADPTVYVGSTDGFVYALSLKDGSLKWKYETAGRVNSTPAIAAGRAYAVSYDGDLHAIDAKTGASLWKFKTRGERRFAAKHLHGAEPAAETMPDPFDFFLSSPATVDGVVYFGSGDGGVYAIDAATGAQRWRFETGDVVHASPAVVDGVVYIGSWDSHFYAIDARTGLERWRHATGKDPKYFNQVGIQSSATVVDGVVYFGCRDSNVYALDAATGARRWAYSNKGSWVIGTPIVDRGRLYFTTSDTGMLRALDLGSGELAGELSLKWPMFSSPSIVGDRLHVGSHAGKFYAVRIPALELIGEFQTEGSKRNLATYMKPDGKPDYAIAYRDSFYDSIVVGVDRLMSVGAVLSSPALAEGVVVFGSTDGRIYALE